MYREVLFTFFPVCITTIKIYSLFHSVPICLISPFPSPEWLQEQYFGLNDQQLSQLVFLARQVSDFGLRDRTTPIMHLQSRLKLQLYFRVGLVNHYGWEARKSSIITRDG